VRGALSACAAVLAVAVAGCGSTAGSGQTDPATLAPATTLAYATFELAPQGPDKAGYDAAFGKLLGPDPERQIGEALTKAAQTSGRLDYAADVKPWLGATATAILTSVAPDHPDYALLLASTDDTKAQAAIDKDLGGGKAAAREYKGVAYKVMDDGTANGIVDHFVVAGTEPAFKSVVDTAKDGTSLGAGEQWKTSVGNRGDGKAGLGYLDAKGLLESLASKLPGAQRLAAPLFLSLLQIHPFVATLDANADSLVVDVSSPGTKTDPRGPAAASSPLIENLPADSWLALALPKVGQALGTLATTLKANALIAVPYASAIAQVRRSTGIDLEKDVLAAIGDVGVFARGNSAAGVGGALVVQSPRPATLARTVHRLPALIRRVARGRARVVSRGSSGFDVTSARASNSVHVRTSADGAVAAYGSPALGAAEHPAARLGDTPLFRTAAAALGQRPTLFLRFGPVLKLVASSAGHRGDKQLQRALPRLRRLRYLAVGARRDGDLDVLRAVLGLR
jgi:hypothetical protein